MLDQEVILNLKNIDRIRDLPTLRKEFDISKLSKEITKKGDLEEVSKKLISIIRPFIPEGMKYKIGEK